MNTSSLSPSVSLLGTGALGTALATCLLARQLPLVIWNRTPARSTPLIDKGAAVASSPASAASKADALVFAVADHNQVRDLVDDIARRLDGLGGRTVLTLSSGTPDEAVALDQRVIALGGKALHGAAMSGTRLIGDPSATFLYSGDRSAYDRLGRVLTAWGRPTYLGSDSGLASLYDTALLGLNLGLLGGAYHAIALLGSAGVKPADVARVAREYLPFAIDLMAEHARQLGDDAVTADDGSLEVYRQVVHHLIETSESRGLDPTLPRGIGILLEAAVADGLGAEGLPALARVIAKAI